MFKTFGGEINEKLQQYENSSYTVDLAKRLERDLFMGSLFGARKFHRRTLYIQNCR